MTLRISVEHEGRKTLSTTFTEAIGKHGYPQLVAGAALKETAMAAVIAVADTYRAKLASASAGKIEAHRIKEEIALDPESAAPAELALIDREAVARGTDRAGLLAQIATRASADRQIALLIECIEAEAKVAVATIADDAADIEAQIDTALNGAKGQASTAFADAQALLAS